ncbi:MAG TPA: amidohydrolase family protein [Arenimonas sp.]|nr:amidohydrolase family protein [Arenimonas sp.]
MSTLLALLLASAAGSAPAPVFDAHLHGARDTEAQIQALRAGGITTIAVSTSWETQQAYRDADGLTVRPGLMFPCPRGKVPYSLQSCFEDGREWPGVEWTQAQVEAGKVHFLGEILTQYYGIPPDDPRMAPYWALAEKHQLPVGIHTGSAGPGHGSPDFSEALGNPTLLRPVLERHPRLRLWVMHAGAPYFDETMALMREYPGVYVDISVINNPAIVPPPAFAAMMKTMLDAGFGDRSMYGSDNADIATTRAALDALGLDEAQENAILHDNAARFFERR